MSAVVPKRRNNMEQSITDSCMQNSDGSWIPFELAIILAHFGDEVVMMNKSKKIFRVPHAVGICWAQCLANQN